MSDVEAKGPIKRVQIEAVIIRADGTREDLGVVADTAKRWRYGPGRVRAWMRTKKANRRMKDGNVRS
jgi:hypothetical protein